jgi:hypothetical protein
LGLRSTSPTPISGNLLDRVYHVLESALGQALVMEFKKIAPNGRLQSMTQKSLTVSTAKLRPVRVLSQERLGTTLKVARDLVVPSKQPPLCWVFETGFIQDLPWDPRECH